MFDRNVLAVCLAWLVMGPLAPTSQSALAAQPAARPSLVVCADPANLPYSNKSLEGFENRIASILADDLQADVTYYWVPERVGFVGRGLNDGKCDVIISVPVKFGPVATTRPYFSSSYVAITRADDPRRFHTFDDDWLRHSRIGVQLAGDVRGSTPPAASLARRGLGENVAAFPMWSEDRSDRQQGKIIEAVAKRDIDVAFVWGPFAGYYSRIYKLNVRFDPVLKDPSMPDLKFVFSMALGVRRSDLVFRDRLQEALDRNLSRIADVLKEYAVPIVETE